jgi:sigma-B regulation protein RsbU (phosphoserine phosphatase)
MNTSLTEQNVSGMFVTLFYGVLDTRTGAIEFANAGHNPPYLFSTDGGFMVLRDKSGPMLGVIEGIEYRTKPCRIDPGEGILLYTDGVTEAIDRNGAFFEEPRLEKFLKEHASQPVEQLALSLHTTVQDFSKGIPQADDITVLALRYWSGKQVTVR